MPILALIVEQLKGTVDDLLFAYMRNLINKEKFEWLKLYYLTNPFLTSAQKHNGLMFFSKIQRTYWAFKSLLRRWKIYKARKNINHEEVRLVEILV